MGNKGLLNIESPLNVLEQQGQFIGYTEDIWF